MAMICTRCGTARLHAEKVNAGSGCLEIFLWCCGIIPGLIYHLWRKGAVQKVCPACGSSQIIPAFSPAGQELQRRYNVTIPVAEVHEDLSSLGYKIIGCVVGFGLLCVLISNAFAPPAHDSTPTPPAPVEWAAKVSVPGGQLAQVKMIVTYKPGSMTIRNLDNFDWIRPEFECGAEDYVVRYYFKTDRIPSFRSITIPVENFKTLAGVGMDRANIRSGFISVKCETADHRNGVRRIKFSIRPK